MQPAPRPVWIRESSRPSRPQLGILVDWKSEPDRRGVLQWHGLVVRARGGDGMPWSVTMDWVWSVNLTPAEVLPPTEAGPEATNSPVPLTAGSHDLPTK